MILFFEKQDVVYATEVREKLSENDIQKLEWLYSGAKLSTATSLEGIFIGPRREMITPWSTNAVEITQNMGIKGILRIEEFNPVPTDAVEYDKMLLRIYRGIGQDVYKIDIQPEPIIYIENMAAYNAKEGLALSEEEIDYLESVSKKIGRKLTDSEVFGFSQVNSEHCRHKIFNGKFIIDGVEKEHTLFQMIKKTTNNHLGRVVSAYKDNCAFVEGLMAEQFAPASHATSDYFEVSDFESVVSIKAETHNFPTTVEPFNGAATGTGGEIRDRMAGGKGAFPMAGTAAYMTSYPRLEEGREWEKIEPRNWLYQTPKDILIKASNGASDFGNKFGQPLICGSLLTFEHAENGKTFGFDKVIMLAGGMGYGKKVDALKDEPKAGDKVVLLGGDNYRIGMGGGAVSSVATGEYAGSIELNAIQRSNPEMQKRAYNAVRALSEEPNNPIVSIHDHGAGGHLNCLSELVELTGGKINIDALPIGDPTLSAKEIVGNESQERIGFVIEEKDIDKVRKISERERAPMYVIGDCTGDMRFTFVNNKTGEKPIDLKLEDFFGKAPRTIMEDSRCKTEYKAIRYDEKEINNYIENVLRIEAVACKDWLTNKVDRSVTGRIAMQQTAGEIQLPVNDYGVIALDYRGKGGMATALGHAAVAAMADARKGSILAIAESLTNIVFTPLADNLAGVSLSANWMWPCKNEGEDARLYDAVEAASHFALDLGINIPTGKDSLSMTQKYPNGERVMAPGTVIVTSAGVVTDVKKSLKATLYDRESQLVYVDFSDCDFALGGSSFAQTMSCVGDDVPTVKDASYLVKAFNTVQEIVKSGKAVAGHDISAGGLITALLEMTFGSNKLGLNIDLTELGEKDLVKILFSEKPAILLQTEHSFEIVDQLNRAGVKAHIIAQVSGRREFTLKNFGSNLSLDINALRDTWFRTSYLFDREQSGVKLATERFNNYKNQPLRYKFPENFTGQLSQYGVDENRREKTGLRAAIIREQGSNGDREMAWALHLAGFDVKDVHTTDLTSGRETLEDLNLIVFVGGFANSDVLNSAKGWAGALLYNEKAKESIGKFYAREDTLSLGVCNGCQLMIELGLITPNHSEKPKMLHNESHKFESCFVGLTVEKNNSVMLGSLSGSKLGVWVSHGEGKFSLPMSQENYNIAATYSYNAYPANPNGSDYNAAALASDNGRHLAIMPHTERSLRPWNWGHYIETREDDQVTPWFEMFVNARKWVAERK